MFGQVQLLLQLRIDRFADQAQAIELLLSLLGTCGLLVHLGRGKQVHRAILLKIAVEGSVIIGSVSQQALEVVRKRVKQFHHGLVVVAARWSQHIPHDDSRQTHDTVQFAAKVLHGFAATDSIRGSANKVTGVFGSFVPDTGHRS